MPLAHANQLVDPARPLLLVRRPRVHIPATGDLAFVAPLRDLARHDLLDGVCDLQHRVSTLRSLPLMDFPEPGRLDHPLQAPRQARVGAGHRRVPVRAVDRRIGRDRTSAHVVRAMSEQRVSSRPALTHLFWWFMFAQGGVIAAILLPVHILFQGILGPLGVVNVASLHNANIIGNPIVKLYLLVLIAVPFFHFAHRLRYLLVDFGVPAAKSVPAQIAFYGGAVLVVILTIYVLLTTAPITF